MLARIERGPREQRQPTSQAIGKADWWSLLKNYPCADMRAHYLAYLQENKLADEDFQVESTWPSAEQLPLPRQAE